MSFARISLCMFLLVGCAESVTSSSDGRPEESQQGGPDRNLPDSGVTEQADSQDSLDDADNARTADSSDTDDPDADPDATVASDSENPDTGIRDVSPGDSGTPDSGPTEADATPADTGTSPQPVDSGGVECSGTEMRSCYTGPAGTSGQGSCRNGSQSCVGGRWGSCSGEVLPSTEDCNGLDDDCDGTVDEGPVLSFLERSCSSTCGSGQQFCTAGVWGTCSAPTPGPAEVCGNGLDDNCNGTIDEGCAPACDSVRQRVGVFSDLRDIEAETAELIGTFLRGRGFDVVVDSNLSDADLIGGNFDIVVGGRFGVNGISNPAILTNWVAAGNALLVLASGSSSDCSGTTTAALRTMQIGLDCTRQALNPVSLFAHPGTSGVSASTSIFAFGTYGSALSSAATNIATAAGGLPGDVAGRNVAVAATYNCGKVLYWGSNAPGEAINWPASQPFWQATVSWLDLE